MSATSSSRGTSVQLPPLPKSRSRRAPPLTPPTAGQAPVLPRKRWRWTTALELALVAAGALWMQLRWLRDLAGIEYVPEGLSGRGTNPSPRRRLLPDRFPRYGSPEFAAACPWAVAEPAVDVAGAAQGPTSLVPRVVHADGISAWFFAVAQAYIYSRRLSFQQKRPPPRLLLEFPRMDVSAVLRPPDARRGDVGWEVAPAREGGAYQWCQSDPNCVAINSLFKKGEVPRYRHAYRTTARNFWIHEGEYDHLKRTLPGFSVETGMACALNSMWEPSPRLAEHEPELFTHLLPELRRDDTLVIAMYLRTGWTDVRMDKESVNKAYYGKYKLWDEDADRHSWQRLADEFLRPFVECAQQLEREYFANYTVSNPNNGQGAEEDAAFSKISWMVSSDSPLLKQYVRDGFHGRNVDVTAGTTDRPTFAVPRQVVFTGAEGAHTNSRWNPRHADVARAFIDWYLLGESDAVIELDKFSFGAAAALRTARPVYSIDPETMDGCTKHPLVHGE